jgi:hypothetical protein
MTLQSSLALSVHNYPDAVQIELHGNEPSHRATGSLPL